MLALAMQFSRFPALHPDGPPCRTRRPVRCQESLRARCTTLVGRSLKAQQCARPDRSRRRRSPPRRGGTGRTGERPTE
jgi:hypothetical protein